ncbi:hypothetical protein M0R45_002721 [Rubus argutus]|uniref:Uncharacterized protein n=1 Tax=Rubus argutus TaxID=59490 RepID=A0AAW1VSE7_RUBAR
MIKEGKGVLHWWPLWCLLPWPWLHYCYIRNKVTKHLKNNRKGADLEDKGGFANLKTAANERVQVFTFKQLHFATGGFCKSNVVGKGGFGLVYGGVLHDGRKVAIKFIGEKKSIKWRWSCLKHLYPGSGGPNALSTKLDWENRFENSS